MKMAFEIWSEKWRPQKLSEVINQEHVVERLKAFIQEGSIPNMIFAGPSGTGKTTCAIILAKELFGENWRQNFQETNASVTPETPIMIRENGVIKRTNFEKLAKKYFVDNSSDYVKTDSLEILSIDENQRIKFMPVKAISRHKVQKVVRIKYEGGTVRTSLNHSIIVMDEEGNLVSKKASELKKGDLLITFKDILKGKNSKLEFKKFKPSLYNKLKSGYFKNPKINKIFENFNLQPDLSWLFGLYLAEGCFNLKKTGSSGQVIFVLGYPEEAELADETERKIRSVFGLPVRRELGSSGFDRSRKSSIQLRIFNTQLAKFFAENFYDDGEEKTALTKRVPSFVYGDTLENRISFLKGYMGDACGKWGDFVRYSSHSKENLIDIAWLGRISGLDTSCFEGESRIVWKSPSASYLRAEFFPAKVLINFFEKLGKRAGFNWRYYLRHHLYHKKCKRISKKIAEKILKKVKRTKLSKDEIKQLENLLKKIKSPLSFIPIKELEIEEYEGYVYDVSVPGIEMFWGGTTPVLLHNSDMRGIDVVRSRIKDFARTKPINAEFKIIFLDESDALTPDAQAALRRVMEMYADVTRFIFSCNYSSRIIPAIQSRAALFRFKPLSENDVRKYVLRIVKGEKLKISEDGIKAIVEIAEGDLRKVANLLQASAALGKKITADTVYEVASRAKPADVREMLELALKGKFEDARKKLQDMLLRQGLSGSDIISSIHKEIYSLDLPEEAKVQLVEKCGEYDFRISEGGNELIQLEALLAQFLLFSKKK
jgi:replication factor C small subunit